ncbi:uncharacterized protein TNCV_3055811 [Trichonephila clavipes]|nr:uncharacterized protein TNCV_3055811 [Trichonephila clavipes]
MIQDYKLSSRSLSFIRPRFSRHRYPRSLLVPTLLPSVVARSFSLYHVSRSTCCQHVTFEHRSREISRARGIEGEISPHDIDGSEKTRGRRKRTNANTFGIKDLLKKWEDVRAMVLEWHPNQADVSRVGDLYNDNAINYFRKILKKIEKQSTLDMYFNAP